MAIKNFKDLSFLNVSHNQEKANLSTVIEL